MRFDGAWATELFLAGPPLGGNGGTVTNCRNDGKPRRERRTPAGDYELEVFDQDSGLLLGHLVEISHCGLKLSCPAPPLPARRFQVKIALPRDYFREPFLPCEILTRWCQPAADGHYHAGFSLCDPCLVTAEQVGHLLNLFGYREREKRFFARLAEFA